MPRTLNSVSKFRRIPYAEQSNNQRWAIACEDLRNKYNWTRRDLAKYFNISRSTTAYWENGWSFPNEEHLSRYAELANISLDELLAHLTNREPIPQSKEFSFCFDALSIQDLVKLQGHINTLISDRVNV